MSKIRIFGSSFDVALNDFSGFALSCTLLDTSCKRMECVEHASTRCDRAGEVFYEKHGRIRCTSTRNLV